MTRIQSRGTLIVGVKTDYPPFGMLTPQGEQIGFEHDLAVDIARRLKVGLRTVGVSGADRLQQLSDGRIDLVLATTADTPERRQIATLIQPDYYSSGVTIMAPPDTHVTGWPDLRGQTVCATQGAYYNRELATRYLLELQVYNNGRDAKLAMRDRRCVGWLFDNTAIQGDLLTDEWKAYKTPTPPQLGTPWGIAIAKEERGGTLERFLGDTVAQWHRDGFLIQTEKKWRLPASEFLVKEHALWSATDALGVPVCRRDADGNWPSQCSNPSVAAALEDVGLYHWGLWLKKKAGIDLTFAYDDYERRRFLGGLAVTFMLTVCCVAGSLLFGLALAFLIEARIPVVSAFLKGSSLMGRMTPPLLQMYILLFGIGSIVHAGWNVHLDPFAVAVLCLSVYTGSMVMQALLNAAEAKRKSAAHFRLTPRTVASLVGTCAVPVSAALVNVAKATMLASVISVPDLLSVSTATIAEHGNAASVMNTVMLVYLIMVYALIRIFSRAGRLLERRCREPE